MSFVCCCNPLTLAGYICGLRVLRSKHFPASPGNKKVASIINSDLEIRKTSFLRFDLHQKRLYDLLHDLYEENEMEPCEVADATPVGRRRLRQLPQ
jgi:hypothetical protein